MDPFIDTFCTKALRMREREAELQEEIAHHKKRCDRLTAMLRRGVGELSSCSWCGDAIDLELGDYLNDCFTFADSDGPNTKLCKSWCGLCKCDLVKCSLCLCAVCPDHVTYHDDKGGAVCEICDGGGARL